MLSGIDISQYQTTTPSLTGLSFVILRATIGTLKDTRYDTHFANVRRAGPWVGAYHYGYGNETVAVKDQVAKFLDVARDADLVFLDQEQAGFSDGEAQEFIDRVRTVRLCGLYHSASGFGGVDADFRWVADWRLASVAAGYPMKADASGEFPNWDIWQYQGSPLDRDLLNSASPLAALFRKGYVPQAQLDAATAQMVALQDANEVLQTSLDQRVAELAAAPGIEKERIAAAFGAAEADLIRNL